MSKLMIPGTHSPRGYEKLYLLTRRLAQEDNVGSQAGQKIALESQREPGLTSMVIRGGQLDKGPHVCWSQLHGLTLQLPKQVACGLSINLGVYGARGEGVWWSFKAYSIETSKMKLDSLLEELLYIPFNLDQINHTKITMNTL